MMARRRISRWAAVPFLTLGLTACNTTPPPPGIERGAQLFDTCRPCHGSGAEGTPEIAAPAIAGLPQWYIEAQLHGFQQGFRGKHQEDLAGLRMRPMAKTLNREGDIESVAQYVAALPAPYPASTLRGGNAGVGAATYEQVCVACHMPGGHGNPDLHSPPIVQMPDWYLVQQLHNFRVGARGADPTDTWGATMRVNALVLSDQAMLDVIAYVQTLR
jgi:cytochrome c oxidase subunit II